MEDKLKLGKTDTLRIDKPGVCNYCGKGIDAKIVNFFIFTNSGSAITYVAMECPVCHEVFFVSYYVGQVTGNNVTFFGDNNIVFSYSKVIGGSGVSKAFSTEIKEISPSFVEIYNQAFRAEQTGLDRIVGISYRKAFEYLIKDYIIFTKIADKEAIAAIPLQQCLPMCFNEHDIEIFNRALWVGNDHTHYVNKHDDLDINDFKQIIDICVSKIELYIKEKKYNERIKKNN